ncbi:hypothetical protein AM593_00500, partial [Mytilus galloprovincialis]
VSSGDYTHRVFAVPSGSRVEKPEIVDKITWADWTSVVGPEVLGIWPKDSPNADVNCTHLSHHGNALATGDDFGYVKLFDFPCREKHVRSSDFI